MGVRSYLRARRERERAITEAELARFAASEGGGPGPATDSTGGDAEPGASDADAAVELPGADPAELARMIRAALADGTPQISTAGHQLDDPGQLGDEILALLTELGRGEPPPAPPTGPDRPTGPSR